MERRADIDRAKGLAILLVVFGHLVARADPAGVGWYEPLRRAVYCFHMPFFFYLSGLVLMLSGAALRPAPGWVGRRAMRLLVPFAAMGLLVVIGKYVLARWMFVDHPPVALGEGLSRLVWHTGESPDGSIWYLAVLFAYSVAVPVVLGGDARRLGWVMALCVGLFFVAVPDDVYGGQMARYAVFFCAGLLAGAHDAGWMRYLRRYWRVWLVIFLGLVAVAVWAGRAIPGLMLPAGLCAIPALHGLVRFSGLRFSRTLLWLGRYCFMIYLFNTIFIGLAKGLLLRVTDWDGGHFLPFAMCLMLAGVLGPVGLKRYAFRRLGRWDRLTD
jgi:fucose 4-O-acetylase-like acetyltransferase